MTDAFAEALPPEPTPETVAEIEQALSAGAVSDYQVMEAAEGVHAVFHALGLDEMHVVYWTEVALAMAAADGTAESVAQYADWLRDWVKDTTAEIKEWLGEHGVPRISTMFITSDGLLRLATIEAP